jgi:hypothetical protein
MLGNSEAWGEAYLSPAAADGAAAMVAATSQFYAPGPASWRLHGWLGR